MALEMERFKMEADLLKRANAGEVYYDVSNLITRHITDCEGNRVAISTGQWREIKTP